MTVFPDNHLFGVTETDGINEDGTPRREIINMLEVDQRLRLIREAEDLEDLHVLKVCTEDGRQIGYLDNKLIKARLEGRELVTPGAGKVLAGQMERGAEFFAILVKPEGDEWNDCVIAIKTKKRVPRKSKLR